MKKEIINMDIIEVLKEFFSKIDLQFTKIDHQFAKIEERFNNLEQKIDERFSYYEVWLNRVEKNMVTKTQFNSLLKILHNKNILSFYDLSHVLTKV